VVAYAKLAPGVLAVYRRALAKRYWQLAVQFSDAPDMVTGAALADAALPLLAELVAAGRMTPEEHADVLESVLRAVAHAADAEWEFDDPIWHEVVLAGWFAV